MTDPEKQSPPLNEPQRYDAVVVGAGFGGLYMLHKLRELGLKVLVLEAGAGVGGTWYWNRYPGARCDVESMQYSYGFSNEIQQQWRWSEKYSPQPEILDYANFVADSLQLKADIRFNTRLEAAHYNERQQSWSLRTSEGRELVSQFCIMATGCLSRINTPDIPGLDSFKGRLLHTGTWPHEEQRFDNERVGIIGTGSSAIQSIPLLAEQASKLTVFQRTPCFSVPARNAAMDEDYERQIKAEYPQFRARNRTMFGAMENRANHVSALAVSAEEREAEYSRRWQEGGLPFLTSFNDLAVREESNATAREFIHRQIHQVVDDSEVADLLCPQTVVGCKRLCVDSNYYQTFNRPNVKLVDIRSQPIESISEHGVKVGDKLHELDSLVLATGFDAMTGALLAIDIRGKKGVSLREKWAEGPRCYLGLSVAGFPNLFTITGPGSPSVLANMIVGIEQHGDWIAACISNLRQRGHKSIEANETAQDHWVNHVNLIADKTLYPTGCNSWYLGDNVPGKPRVFMPYLGFPDYVSRCEEIVAANYRGFEFN